MILSRLLRPKEYWCRPPMPLVFLALWFLMPLSPVLAVNLQGLTVTSVAPNGTETPVGAYRWLVEQDKTYHVQTLPGGAADPTTFDPNWDQLQRRPSRRRNPFGRLPPELHAGGGQGLRRA